MHVSLCLFCLRVCQLVIIKGPINIKRSCYNVGIIMLYIYIYIYIYFLFFFFFIYIYKYIYIFFFCIYITTSFVL